MAHMKVVIPGFDLQQTVNDFALSEEWKLAPFIPTPSFSNLWENCKHSSPYGLQRLEKGILDSADCPRCHMLPWCICYGSIATIEIVKI